MVELSNDEMKWLGENYPSLSYDKAKGIITGFLEFDLCYKDKPRIHDCYKIKIDLSSIKSRMMLPKVYNIDGRINAIAKRKQISTADLHLNSDNTLCLIFPLKIKDKYPTGVTIQKFIEHLSEHLYWVSFYERYNKEPWKGEQHSLNALIEYILENKSVLKDEQMIEFLRIIYGAIYLKFITRNDLKKKLENPTFMNEFKIKCHEQGFIR